MGVGYESVGVMKTRAGCVQPKGLMINCTREWLYRRGHKFPSPFHPLSLDVFSMWLEFPRNVCGLVLGVLGSQVPKSPPVLFLPWNVNHRLSESCFWGSASSVYYLAHLHTVGPTAVSHGQSLKILYRILRDGNFNIILAGCLSVNSESFHSRISNYYCAEKSWKFRRFMVGLENFQELSSIIVQGRKEWLPVALTFSGGTSGSCNMEVVLLCS